MPRRQLQQRRRTMMTSMGTSMMMSMGSTMMKRKKKRLQRRTDRPREKLKRKLMATAMEMKKRKKPSLPQTSSLISKSKLIRYSVSAILSSLRQCKCWTNLERSTLSST